MAAQQLASNLEQQALARAPPTELEKALQRTTGTEGGQDAVEAPEDAMATESIAVRQILLQAAEHLEAALKLAWQADQRAEVESELKGMREVLAQLEKRSEKRGS